MTICPGVRRSPIWRRFGASRFSGARRSGPAHVRPARRRARRAPAPQGLAGPQAEAGVVPGTANRLVDDQALRQRAVVVAAKCIDRDHVRSELHQQHGIVPDMTQQLAVDEILRRNTLREIGTAWFVVICHCPCFRSAYRPGAVHGRFEPEKVPGVAPIGLAPPRSAQKPLESANLMHFRCQDG